MNSRITRAFDRPLTTVRPASAIEAAVFEQVRSQPLDFVTDCHSGAFTANPGRMQDGISHIYGSMVKITNHAGAHKGGSGFLAIDSAGRRAVVTAAHVVGGYKHSDLELTDYYGNATGVTHGSYIIERQGCLLDPRDEYDDIGEIDVAVIYPETPIGSHTLAIGSLAARGTWLDVINYQMDIGKGERPAFDKPAHFKCAVLDRRPDSFSSIMTGVEIERSASESLYAHVAQPAGSGGPALDVPSGVVRGIVFGGHFTPPRPDRLKHFNVSFDRPITYQAPGGFRPLIAVISDPKYARLLLTMP